MTNLQQLIAAHKGPKSYRELAEQSGGRLEAKAFHSVATTATTAKLPSPAHLEGIASALGIPIRDVILAAATSAGLTPEPIPDVQELREQLLYYRLHTAAYKGRIAKQRAQSSREGPRT